MQQLSHPHHKSKLYTPIRYCTRSQCKNKPHQRRNQTRCSVLNAVIHSPYLRTKLRDRQCLCKHEPSPTYSYASPKSTNRLHVLFLHFGEYCLVNQINYSDVLLTNMHYVCQKDHFQKHMHMEDKTHFLWLTIAFLTCSVLTTDMKSSPYNLPGIRMSWLS